MNTLRLFASLRLCVRNPFSTISIPAAQAPNLSDAADARAVRKASLLPAPPLRVAGGRGGIATPGPVLPYPHSAS